MGGGMMRIFCAALLMLVHVLVVSRPTSGAAVDRYESDRQRHTAVINFMDTTKGRRSEDVITRATTVEYGWGGEEEENDDEYYYEDEYEDGMSGDYDMVPRVSKSSQPKDPSAILETESTEGKRRTGKGRKRAKGKGRKRNPCLKKYKDFCIHGTCQYLRNIRQPACVCHPNYSGERCEFITLPVHSPEGYNRTTALAVVAVVLSSVCLTIIGLLLMLRFHKRGAYDVESEEKVKLGLSSNH